MQAAHDIQRQSQLQLSELMASLSKALDITEGQPPGHCIRVCWIGFHIGERCGLSAEELHELYYTLLLKDLGCSSNAARICELYVTDDLSFKHNFKTVNGSLSQVVNFVVQNTGLKKNLAERFKAILNIIKNGDEIAQDLIQTRCDRGAEIAKQLRFGPSVSEAIRSLDEHWNGGGRPAQLAGQAIPLFARIALLAQVADVFHQSSGRDAALRELTTRAGTWFDPELVQHFVDLAEQPTFWAGLEAENIQQQVLAFEPAQHSVSLDDDYLDEIAAAFGQIVDSKSPYTAGHSERVALYTDLIGQQLGFNDELRRWLKRGALLHDIGKLGVSNSILDKPGKLDEDEWIEMRMHAVYTEEILCEIAAFKELARVSAAHHERLDGKGYPRGIKGEQISLATRAITVADIFDAITADRPYRAPIPIAKALSIMQQELDSAIDRQCFAALKLAIKQLDLAL